MSNMLSIGPHQAAPKSGEQLSKTGKEQEGSQGIQNQDFQKILGAKQESSHESKKPQLTEDGKEQSLQNEALAQLLSLQVNPQKNNQKNTQENNQEDNKENNQSMTQGKVQTAQPHVDIFDLNLEKEGVDLSGPITSILGGPKAKTSPTKAEVLVDPNIDPNKVQGQSLKQIIKVGAGAEKVDGKAEKARPAPVVEPGPSIFLSKDALKGRLQTAHLEPSKPVISSGPMPTIQNIAQKLNKEHKLNKTNSLVSKKVLTMDPLQADLQKSPTQKAQANFSGEEFSQIKNESLKAPVEFNRARTLYQNAGLNSSHHLVKNQELTQGVRPSEFKQADDLLTQLNQNDLTLARGEQPTFRAEAVKAQVATPQVFELNNLNTNNANEIISKISDYLVQSKFGNEKEVEINVQHKELGNFKVIAQKNLHNIKMIINTQTQNGHEFFESHKGRLIENLKISGFNVSDLKLEGFRGNQNSQSLNLSDFRDGRNQNAFQQNQQSHSFYHNQDKNQQERRQALWEYAQHGVEA